MHQEHARCHFKFSRSHPLNNTSKGGFYVKLWWKSHTSLQVILYAALVLAPVISCGQLWISCNMTTSSQVVNAIHGAFKNGYFPGIYGHFSKCNKMRVKLFILPLILGLSPPKLQQRCLIPDSLHSTTFVMVDEETSISYRNNCLKTIISSNKKCLIFGMVLINLL